MIPMDNVTTTDRNPKNNERGFMLWLTGVPASGKSTIAKALEGELRARGVRLHNFDGDEWRAIMTPDLGYDKKARDQNLHRIAYVGSLLTRNGVHAIVAAVSPDREFRDRARAMNPEFLEVWVKATFETVKTRDPKGLYKKGAEGKVNDIPGWHVPFEEPQRPELVLDTDSLSVGECVAALLAVLEKRRWIPPAFDVSYSPEEEAQIKARLERLGYL